MLPKQLFIMHNNGPQPSPVSVTPTSRLLNNRLSFPGEPIGYRIEEYRKTVYITSNVPPAQWAPETVREALGFAGIPNLASNLVGARRNSGTSNFANNRRTRFMPGSTRDTHSDHLGESPSPNSPRSTQSPRTPEVKVGPKAPTPFNTTPTTPVQREASPRNTPPPTPVQREAFPRSPPSPPPRILFYHREDPHYGFTNFSPHPVMYNGRRYPTSEHLFQSFKFEHRPDLAEHIRTFSERPSAAFSEARRFSPEVRPDWMSVNISKMDEVILHKFTQHTDLRDELLATGDAELVEDSDKDAFWGIGADQRGRNELGKALMRLRDNLRAV